MTYFFKFPTQVPNSQTVIDVLFYDVPIYDFKYDVTVTMSPWPQCPRHDVIVYDERCSLI